MKFSREDLAKQLKGIIENVIKYELKSLLDVKSIIEGDATNLHLTEDLGLDSLDMMRIFFEIEEKFGIFISEEDIDAHLMDVVSFLDYLEEKLAKSD